jgi:hypothetical protein
MSPQLLDSWFPILVLLTATQKTKATRRTIRVYSTNPCPSSSTINLLKSSILTPKSFYFINEQRVNYEAAPQPVGFDRQVEMSPQLLDSWFPTLVLLIATQKTKATRRTIRVYSTKPCPSSSTINLLKSSISISPPFLSERLPKIYCSPVLAVHYLLAYETRFKLFRTTGGLGARSMPSSSSYIFQ